MEKKAIRAGAQHSTLFKVLELILSPTTPPFGTVQGPNWLQPKPVVPDPRARAFNVFGQNWLRRHPGAEHHWRNLSCDSGMSGPGPLRGSQNHGIVRPGVFRRPDARVSDPRHLSPKPKASARRPEIRDLGHRLKPEISWAPRTKVQDLGPRFRTCSRSRTFAQVPEFGGIGPV